MDNEYIYISQNCPTKAGVVHMLTMNSVSTLYSRIFYEYIYIYIFVSYSLVSVSQFVAAMT